MRGVVRRYVEVKGWGFIHYNDQDIFFHKNESKGIIKENDHVEFDIRVEPNGKMCAINVKSLPFCKW